MLCPQTNLQRSLYIMSLFGSIYTSMSGLSVSANGLDNLSKNIANINTPGYKATDLYYRTNSGDDAEIGGSSLRFTAGDIRSTGVQTDLAISGEGLFILRDGEDLYFTRSGQFQFNSDGYLVDPVSNYRVAFLNEAGSLEDLNINNVKGIDFNRSSQISLEGGLNNSAAEGDVFPPKDGEPIEINVVDENGAEHLVDLTFTKGVGNQWTVDFLSKNGSRVQKSHVIEFNSLGSLISDTENSELNFTDYEFLSDEEYKKSFSSLDKTSVKNEFYLESLNDGKMVVSLNGDLEFISAGHFSLDSHGKIVNTETGGVLFGQDSDGVLTEYDLSDSLTMPPKATSQIHIQGNLDKNYSVLSSQPPQIIDKIIYPPLSESGVLLPVLTQNAETVNLTMRFTKQTVAGDLWSVNITDETDPSHILTATTNRNLGFDSLGNLLNGTIGVALTRSDGSKLNFSLDFSGGASAGLTLLDEPSDINISSNNGYLQGDISDIAFGSDNKATFYYSNGQTLVNNKLALVNPDERRVSGVKVDFSQLLAVDGASQAKVEVKENDGFLAGSLLTYSFLEDGTFEVEYSNGEKREFGSIALAKFESPERLNSLNGFMFTNKSNLKMDISAPKKGSLGTLISKSVEMSNVDLSQEFSQIIIIQRGYQASSQVLNVANKMIEDLYNSLVR